MRKSVGQRENGCSALNPRAIDGPLTVTACSTEKISCEQYGKCSIRDPLWRIRERIVSALGTVSLAEMANESEAPLPVPAAHAAILRTHI